MVLRGSQRSLLSVVLVGCAAQNRGDVPQFDADAVTDARTQADIVGDASTLMPFDVSPDQSDVVPRGPRQWGDAGPPRPSDGCQQSLGFNCIASFDEQCSPPCEGSRCCVGRAGRFACAERLADQTCPTADLRVDAERLRVTASIAWTYFAANHCAVEERCVRAPGWRRLLRFESTTANTGEADLFLGAAGPSAGFVFSACHGHFHFAQYAQFSLIGQDGRTQVVGRKQGFCIEDSLQWPSRVEALGSYQCARQGLSVGWADVYRAGIDCQWLDVTDVPEGTYVLRAEVNPERVLAESDYRNNVGEAEVSIPADESALSPLRPCDVPSSSLARQCGWHLSGSFSCTPGALSRAACSSLCGLGQCEGDTIMRVCPGDQPCSARDSLASNDDSLCSAAVCSAGGDCCSDTQFVCPNSGRVTVLSGARDVRLAASCVVQVR